MLHIYSFEIKKQPLRLLVYCSYNYKKYVPFYTKAIRSEDAKISLRFLLFDPLRGSFPHIFRLIIITAMIRITQNKTDGRIIVQCSLAIFRPLVSRLILVLFLHTNFVTSVNGVVKGSSFFVGSKF
jgi:hypothetical protein